MTLLHRAVLAAAQSGVRDFILVGDGGAGWEAVTAGLAGDRRVIQRSLRLRFVPVGGLEEAVNEPRVDRPFWLFRGNLVFDPELPGAVAGADRGEDEVLQSAGGLTLCPAAVFPRLAKALQARGAVPAAEAELLDQVRGPAPLRAVDAGPRFCFEVTDQPSFKKAEQRLLATARKATDGYISRNINRRVSLCLTRQFLKTGIAPSVQSVVTLLIGLASGWFISRGGYGPAALGAFLFNFASIFDGCDGENARLTYRTSKFGGFLDIGGDAVIFVLFFVCLPIGLYRETRHPVWAILGSLALVSMGLFYAQLVTHMKRTKLGNNIVAIAKDIETSAGKPGFSNRVDAAASRIAFIYRRDFFSTAACVIILAGGAKVLMAVLAFFLPVEAVYMFFFSRRRLGPAQPGS